MKNVLFLLALLLITSAGFSQKRKRLKKETFMKLEQRRTLAVKKLTVQLDLDQRQTNKVAALIKELSTKRMAKKLATRKAGVQQRKKVMKLRKESKDVAHLKRKIQQEIATGDLKKEDLRRMRRRRLGNSFEAKNTALDYTIALQRGMKIILNEAQFTTYKKIQHRNMRTAKMNMKKAKKTKMAKRLKSVRR